MKTRNAIIGLTWEKRVAVVSREDTMRIGAGMTAAEKSTPAFRQKLKAVVFDWGLGLLLALALGGNAAAQTVCVPPPSGMISWWDGDGDANDIQGANDGTLIK